MNIFQSRGYIIREEEDMRLEELLNQYSDRLSENDLYIWDYVEKHKNNVKIWRSKNLQGNVMYPEQQYFDLQKAVFKRLWWVQSTS